ncbi:methyl-accepting chemotaxis protein [Myxococcus sp. AM009]|uniref:methyl-accepting chemotaxis protein n=1 Tax=unclassified Myxococcus TaxID=2648731 RepID=UPI001595107A|nr:MULTISPECIES: methyl-accepting chemotaxis protein [unclassified Myxococcus]NVI97455.1 methyl-accepting chemotaxis protein [Myxococcus sp. AM009]NVJ15111.1 methyl-accepting chemotaxis protein [Myxococcus sp. AM010]
MRLSLTHKITLAPIVVALLFVFLSQGYTVPRLQEAFEAQGRELSGALPTVLASALADGMKRSAHDEVQQTLEAVARHGGLAYVAAFDAGGTLVGVAGEKAQVLRDAREQLKSSVGGLVLRDGDTELQDLVAPVPGDAGWVHVGFDRTHARGRVEGALANVGLTVLVALLVFVAAAFMVSRAIVAPLLQLSSAVRHIAEHGDLRQTIRIDSDDEVGQLARAVGLLVGKLKELLHQLQSSTELLSDSVSGLSESADQQNEMVTRHAAALQETQVTAQEIRQTAMLASGSAESVIQVAERAEQLSRTGEEAVSASIDGMEEVRNQVSEIAARITSLGERTKQISGITETVKDLADQSHLLAVNAAIEAARSGEHGKGFVVVAKEIRALADQSIRATNQVRRILQDINQAIIGTVEITVEGTELMEAGLTQVRTSGETLKQLTAIVEDSTAAARQIARTVSQQATGIEQIFTAVNELNTLMTDTVSRISTTSDSALSLKMLSERVSQVVRAYDI